MIKFFRKIRQNLLSDGKTGKYFKYAIGEIILVVIGILIALSINNWNEKQKDKRTAFEIYKNLQRSLEQDSIAIQGIIELQTKSLKAQKSIFLNSIEEFETKYAKKNLDSLIQTILFGTFTFYPKDGIYNLIVSNNGMDLIESNKIKSALNNLYEFQYKRYENLDPVVENKFQYQMNSLVSKKLGFVVEFNSGVEIISSVNPELFKKHYQELSEKCRDIFSILSAGNKLLKEIRNSINELLELLRNELEISNY